MPAGCDRKMTANQGNKTAGPTWKAGPREEYWLAGKPTCWLKGEDERAAITE